MPKKEETKPEDISTVIQKKFLEERKIFLWGEVSDKSAKISQRSYSTWSGRILVKISLFTSTPLVVLLLLAWPSLIQ